MKWRPSFNEQIDKNIDLNKRLAESTADSILDQISEGLAVTQKEKLASLAESVEFESEDEYREKLETLKESYFSKSSPAPKVAQQQTLSEGVDTTESSCYRIYGRISAFPGRFQKVNLTLIQTIN